MVRIQFKYIKNDVKTSKAKFKTQWKNNEGHNPNDLRFRKLNANRTELHQSESSVRSFFPYKEYLTKILLFFFSFAACIWCPDLKVWSTLLLSPPAGPPRPAAAAGHTAPLSPLTTAQSSLCLFCCYRSTLHHLSTASSLGRANLFFRKCFFKKSSLKKKKKKSKCCRGA